MTTRLTTLSLRFALSGALSGALAGCALSPDADLDTAQEDIINGDAIPSANSGLPMLTDGGSGCSSLLLDNDWILTAAHCVESYFDHGFDGDGQALIKFAGQKAQEAKAIAVDLYGRALVAGFVWDGTASRFGLARVRLNGSPDPYFASGAGRVTTSFPGADTAAASAVAIDGNDRIVVAGYAHTAGGDVLALARYTASGALDTSFGTGGRVLTDVPQSSAEEIHGVLVDGSGRIVVGASARVDAHEQWMLARYTDGGALDPTWHGNGVVITDFTSTADETVAGIALDHSGRIIAVGSADDQIAVARYRSDGYLDTTFDGDGKALARYGGAATHGNALAIDAQNRIVVTGDASASHGMLVARFTAAGALDPTFDGNGWTALSPRLTWSDGTGRAVTIDAQGRILVAGSVSTTSALDAFALGRLGPSGALDDTFDTVNGVIASYAIDTAAGVAYEAFGNGVALDPSGNIYLSFELDGLSSTEGAFGVAHVLAESHDVSAWPSLAIAMGTQSVGASRVVRHPNLDAALVQLAAPLVMNGATTGYRFQGFYTSAPSTLVGKTLDCYGWGYDTTTGGYGTLRTADLEVASASADAYVLDANARNQIVYRGDSGGPCFVNPGTHWYVSGITSYGNTATATQLAASAISAWVAQIRGT